MRKVERPGADQERFPCRARSRRSAESEAFRAPRSHARSASISSQALHEVLQKRGRAGAARDARLGIGRDQKHVAVAGAAKLGGQRGGEAFTASSTSPRGPRPRSAGLPEIEHDRGIAAVRLLELPHHHLAGSGRSSPVDPAAAIATLPGAEAIKIAIEARAVLAALIAGERIVPESTPVLRQPTQARQDGQRGGCAASE